MKRLMILVHIVECCRCVCDDDHSPNMFPFTSTSLLFTVLTTHILRRDKTEEFGKNYLVQLTLGMS